MPSCADALRQLANNALVDTDDECSVASGRLQDTRPSSSSVGSTGSVCSTDSALCTPDVVQSLSISCTDSPIYLQPNTASFTSDSDSSSDASVSSCAADSRKCSPSCAYVESLPVPQFNNNGTKATFRQEDVLPTGGFVNMNTEQYVWAQSFPTLFIPRCVMIDKKPVWRIFHDLSLIHI